jgi:hypothetical protein
MTARRHRDTAGVKDAQSGGGIHRVHLYIRAEYAEKTRQLALPVTTHARTSTFCGDFEFALVVRERAHAVAPAPVAARRGS